MLAFVAVVMLLLILIIWRLVLDVLLLPQLPEDRRHLQ